jgi:hypothetical protein
MTQRVAGLSKKNSATTMGTTRMRDSVSMFGKFNTLRF